MTEAPFAGSGRKQNGESASRRTWKRNMISGINENYRYTQAAAQALKYAGDEAKAARCAGIGTEHLLLGLVREENGTAGVVLREGGIRTDELRRLVENLIGGGRAEKNAAAVYTPRAELALRTASEQAEYFLSKEIGTEHLLLALARDIDCNAAKLLHTLNMDFQGLYQRILDIIGVSDEQMAEYMQSVVQSAAGGVSSTPVLDQYSRDLTDAVRDGKIDPIVGRETETRRICQILCRKTKNNPCLIGEPGVGKTAIVEGLAQKIVYGDVPLPLKNKRLVALDMAGMVAGTKYRGEFEDRIKKVLNEVSGSGDILLFIDELHTIIGAGSSEGGLDASNIMKPMLSRGEIQVIGATTVDEYRKRIGKDAALERRFQSILVEEPSFEETREILTGLRESYEKHHGVTIPDEAIEAAVKLSGRYIGDRFLPDKAIDLLDEACSRRQLGFYHLPEDLDRMRLEIEKKNEAFEEALAGDNLDLAHSIHTQIEELRRKFEKKKAAGERRMKKNAMSVTTEDIAAVVSDWTKIPVQKLTEDESRRLVKLEKTLHRRIIGQDEAVEAVAKAIRRGRAGLKDPRRPIGSFLFLGPTGVGKTELSKALAEIVFGSESSMIRVDMSEYMEKFDVSKLVGSPPGYVGYEEGGQLSEQVRRHPYSVVLFDEIEKAHPDIFNILLQVLDEGHITDSQGRKVDFKNTILIMTSNAGAQSIAAPKNLGFGAGSDAKANYETMKGSVMEEVRRIFRPEFLNRIDDTIVFHSLNREELRQIVSLLLKELASRAEAQMQIRLKFRSSVRDQIAEKGFDVKYGARPLRRAVQNEIEDELAEEILSGKIKAGQHVVCTVRGGKIVFVPGKEEEKAQQESAEIEE